MSNMSVWIRHENVSKRSHQLNPYIVNKHLARTTYQRYRLGRIKDASIRVAELDEAISRPHSHAVCGLRSGRNSDVVCTIAIDILRRRPDGLGTKRDRIPREVERDLRVRYELDKREMARAHIQQSQICRRRISGRVHQDIHQQVRVGVDWIIECQPRGGICVGRGRPHQEDDLSGCVGDDLGRALHLFLDHRVRVRAVHVPRRDPGVEEQDVRGHEAPPDREVEVDAVVAASRRRIAFLSETRRDGLQEFLELFMDVLDSLHGLCDWLSGCFDGHDTSGYLAGDLGVPDHQRQGLDVDGAPWRRVCWNGSADILVVYE